MRVALFCETLNPKISPSALFYSHLAKSLSELGHQVSIWTGPFNENGAFEIESVQHYYLFQKFRVWELPRILPHLMQIQPEVFHFFPQIDRYQTRLHVMNALAVLARSLRGPIVLTSLLENSFEKKDSAPRTFNAMQTLLEQSHLITTVDKSQLSQVKASQPRAENFEIWPRGVHTHSVRSKPQDGMSKNISEALESFIEKNSHILILPGPLANHDPKQLKILLETCSHLEKIGVLVTEGWGTISQSQRRRHWLPLLNDLIKKNRLLITGAIDQPLRQRIQKQSLGCWISSLTPSAWRSQTLFWIHQELWGRTFINTDQQQEFAIDPLQHPDFIVFPIAHLTEADQQNRLAHQLSFLPKISCSHLDVTSENRLTSAKAPAYLDDPYNHLSRIYASLFSQQRT